MELSQMQMLSGKRLGMSDLPAHFWGDIAAFRLFPLIGTAQMLPVTVEQHHEETV